MQINVLPQKGIYKSGKKAYNDFILPLRKEWFDTMELPKEWKARTELWLKALEQDVFHEKAVVEAEVFFTKEHLLYDEAMKRDFTPMSVGTVWGDNFEYMWVRATAVIPAELDGKAVVMDVDAGGESCVWINGIEFGCRRNEWVKERLHQVCDLELTGCAKAGDTYSIVCEVYAGNPIPWVHQGPITGGDRPHLEEEDVRHDRARYNGIKLCEWNEDAFQLYLDATFLSESLRFLSEDTLRYDDVREALNRFTVIVDFEAPQEERTEMYRKAREALRPAMEAKNGTVAPLMYGFGHAHIDVAWLWSLGETERKVMRTFATQLRHMDRYPEYKFIQSQAYLYRYVKKFYPAMFERIKEKVKNGQWIPEGGMWVEADTNVASGEALIRQFLHGKRFFKDELGYDSKMLWLPDVFGYNAALPEIMKGCGIDYFCTQKINWAYHGGEAFPVNYFNWIGLDGTKLPTFIHGNYSLEADPVSVYNLWKNRRQKRDLRGYIMPYGYGDGGGGPCRSFIENIRREADFQGLPKVENRHPNDYFVEHPDIKESYVGELYLQCHRGTLTSQAKTKRNNRKCELALRETEYWGLLAKQHGYAYPKEEMDELWKTALLLQFHDILPGSSIHRVYTEAAEQYDGVFASLAKIRKEAMAFLTEKGEALTVTNSLPFERSAAIKLPQAWQGAEGLPVQEIGGDRYALVDLPASGTAVLRKGNGTALSGATASLNGTGAVMENSLLRVIFNEKGEITSIFDKTNERELCRGTSNEMLMFRDDPARFDAWDIDSTYLDCPVALPEKATLTVEAASGFEARLIIERKLAHSTLRQTAVLFENCARVDFVTEMDWHETHKLLKVGFNVDYQCDEAINEIQFGYVKRPNHRSRQYDSDRFEVSNYRYTALAEAGRGFAVLNDCKYGISQDGTNLRLTLLKSATSPDPLADEGKHVFTYGFVAYDGALGDGEVLRNAADLNVAPEVFNGAFEAENVIFFDAAELEVSALKPAEDGSNDYILRMNEPNGTSAKGILSLSLPCSEITLCDMTEEGGTPVSFTREGDTVLVPLTFGAFEIKTLRIRP